MQSGASADESDARRVFDRLSPGSKQRIATLSAERAREMFKRIQLGRDIAQRDGADVVRAVRRAIELASSAELAEIHDAARREDWARMYASNLLLSSFLSKIQVKNAADVDRVLAAMEWMASQEPPSDDGASLQ